MIAFEMNVLPGMKYPTRAISQIIEQALKYVNPDEDWSVRVEQKDDHTLEVSMMSVN